jgi:hypothetical protein
MVLGPFENLTNLVLDPLPRALLPDLEAIKHVMGKKHQASLKAKAKEASAASTTAMGSSKKRSASRNPGERVPKKVKPVKFYQHCKNKGSPRQTHNTKEFCRYHKGDNPVTAPALKPTMQRSPSRRGATSRRLI